MYKNRDLAIMDVYINPHESLFSFYLVVCEGSYSKKKKTTFTTNFSDCSKHSRTIGYSGVAGSKFSGGPGLKTEDFFF